MGCPRCHGDAAPPRGLGRELADPSGCAPRLRSDREPRAGGCLAPRPDLTRYIAQRSWTVEAGVFDPNRRLYVGGVLPPRFRPGREPRAGSFQPQGCLLAPGQPKKRGAVGVWGGAGERRSEKVHQGERSPPTVRNPYSRPLAPWSHTPGRERDELPFSIPGMGCAAHSAEA